MTNQVNDFNELLEARYPVTLFAGKAKPQGREVDHSYRKFLSKLSNLYVSESKDTALISPCRLDKEYRSDENVLEINQLVFDIDDPKGVSFERLAELISPYAGCLHTTHSHRVDNPRYRIVLPLSRPVSVSEWRQIREAFLFFNSEINEIIDPACKEPSRAFYVWSAPPDQIENANFFVSIGVPIKPESFISPHAKATVDKRSRSFEEISQGGVAEGSRNSSLASFVGGLINRGFSREETLIKCTEWNETLQPPMDSREVKATHDSIWKRHLANNGKSTPSVNREISSVERPKTFDLISAGQLLSENPRPREYIVEGFLPKKVVAGLFAPGGAGKSNATLTTSVSVSSGTLLFGKFIVKKPGRVVIISGEDDREEIQRRLHRITETLTDPEKDLVKKNLYILDLADKFELFTYKPSHGEIEITNIPEAIAISIEATLGGADLVIVDPASRFRGGEENLAADATRFVQALQYLRDRLGATIWLVHHVNKGASGNGANQNNARGSSALIDGLRLAYELNVIARKDAVGLYGDSVADIELLSLRSVKSNYGRAAEPITLRRNLNGTLTGFHQNPSDSREHRLLTAIGSAQMSKTQFRSRYAGVSGPFGLAEKPLMAAIESLVKKGLVYAPDRAVMTLSKEGLEMIEADGSLGNHGAADVA